MRVDEPRSHDESGRIDHLRVGNLQSTTDVSDHAVFNEHVVTRQVPESVVHRDDERIADQQPLHSISQSLSQIYAVYTMGLWRHRLAPVKPKSAMWFFRLLVSSAAMRGAVATEQHGVEGWCLWFRDLLRPGVPMNRLRTRDAHLLRSDRVVIQRDPCAHDALRASVPHPSRVWWAASLLPRGILRA